MNITSNSCSYIVKLDDIDMNYLINTTSSSETISPLWSLNKLKTRKCEDYCEFKVTAQLRDPACFKAQEDHCSDVDDDLYDINTNKYKCVICNLDVPTMFRSEHNHSPKHRISIKIAHIVLERVKDLMTNSEVRSHSYINSDFCEPCALGVKATDMKAHISSNKHQKALLHDRLLNDLLMVYEDSENLESIDFEYLRKDKTSCEDGISSANSKQSEEFNVGENVAIQLDHNFKEVNHVKNHAENSKDNLNIQPNITVHVDTMSLNTSDQFDHTKQDEEPCTQAKIQPPQSSNDIGLTYCKPCSRYIHTHNFKSHSNGSKHRLSKQIYIQSKKSLVEPSTDSTSSHNVPPGKDSAVSIDSTANAVDASSFNARSAIEDMRYTYESTPADKLETLSHTSDIKAQNEVQSMIAEIKPTEETNVMYHAKWNGLNYVCQVCKVKLTWSTSNISGHIQGRNHRFNYNEMLKENNISNKDGKLFCDHCKVYIDEAREYEHIETEEHKVSGTETYECTLCNEFVLFSERETHNENPSHKMKELFHKFDASWDRMINNIDLRLNSYMCTFCKKRVPLSNRETHESSSIHKMNGSFQLFDVSTIDFFIRKFAL